MKIKPKSDQETQDSDFNEDGTKSHKQIIQELILESKRKRFEKSKEADENYELVCKLDDDFKNPDIRNLLLMGGKDKRLTEVNQPPQKGEYDHLVKELQFETKTGRATDRLKTEDELALEEREKLEQLEKERLRRMQMSDVDQTGSSQHRSADDLDDG
jgi:nucleolar protein 14